MTRSRVMLFPLFKDLAVQTNGTALSKTSMDIDIPGLRALLPYAEALFLITSTDGLATTGIAEWNVAFASGFDKSREPFPSADISSSVFNIDGPKRCVDYTTVTNFLLESRLTVWWQNATGVSGVKKFEIGAVLGVRLYA